MLENMIKIRKANSKDAIKIISLIKAQHNYESILKQGNEQSKEGFLLAKISQDECHNLVSNEIVYVAVKDGTEIVGVLIATRPLISKYENLSNPRILWKDKWVQAVYDSDNFIYLWVIAINKKYQRTGIGKLLVEKLKTTAAVIGQDGIITDFMEAPIWNIGSKFFFEAVGFKPCGKLKISDYFGAGESSWRIYHCRLEEERKRALNTTGCLQLTSSDVQSNEEVLQ